MMGILTIVIMLLPIVGSNYAEIRFIRKINKCFNFDHNVYLVDSSTDRNEFTNVVRHIGPYIYAKELTMKFWDLGVLQKSKVKRHF